MGCSSDEKVLNFVARLLKSAHLGCSSVKQVLIFIAHLLKSAHLACSSWKKVLIFAAHLIKSAHLSCSSAKKVLIFVAHLIKSAHLLCSSAKKVLISLAHLCSYLRWAPDTTVLPYLSSYMFTTTSNPALSIIWLIMGTSRAPTQVLRFLTCSPHHPQSFPSR